MNDNIVRYAKPKRSRCPICKKSFVPFSYYQKTCDKVCHDLWLEKCKQDRINRKEKNREANRVKQEAIKLKNKAK